MAFKQTSMASLISSTDNEVKRCAVRNDRG